MQPPPLRRAPPVIVPGIPVARRRPSAPGRNLTLVVGALPQETELVERALERRRRTRIAGFPAWEGRIGGRRVFAAVTGIGKTNASMVAALALAALRPREVIMCGTASRINPEVRNGDVIVGETTANHDMGSLGPGFVMEYFASEGPLGDHSPIVYPADSKLLAAARRAIATFVPETASHHSPPYVPAVRTGRIVSGDQFGITAERIADILRQLQPDLMEMESGSVAQVCHYLRTPFLCIRAGSNRTQASPDNDYRALSPFAARQAALFTVAVIRELAAR